jgi:hypothetical protein
MRIFRFIILRSLLIVIISSSLPVIVVITTMVVTSSTSTTWRIPIGMRERWSFLVLMRMGGRTTLVRISLFVRRGISMIRWSWSITTALMHFIIVMVISSSMTILGCRSSMRDFLCLRFFFLLLTFQRLLILRN